MFLSNIKNALKKIVVGMVGIQNTNKVFSRINNIRALILRILRNFEIRVHKSEVKYLVIGVTENNHQFFFGYYDISPINFNDTILLATRIPLHNTYLAPNNLIEIGYFSINKKNSAFENIDFTNTWNWQQGCRLQWYPLNQYGRNNLVIFNKMIENHYGCCIKEITTKRILKTYNRPIYFMSPDGRYGLSLNFSRLGRLRPGYGYTILPDETTNQRTPDSDGIWCIEMESGEDHLLFTIADMAKFEAQATMLNAEHYFNHICVNPDGSRFLFFHVWLLNGKRYTRLITCNIDGSDPFALINDGQVSHYTWKSFNEIICYSSHKDSGPNYYLYKDKSKNRKIIGEGVFDSDGHPSLSPDQKFLLTDTYPDLYSDRHLLLYNFNDKTLKKLGSFYSPFKFKGEIRCDLHPRWSPSGNYIVFDSTHEGRRGMYLIKPF